MTGTSKDIKAFSLVLASLLFSVFFFTSCTQGYRGYSFEAPHSSTVRFQAFGAKNHTTFSQIAKPIAESLIKNYTGKDDLFQKALIITTFSDIDDLEKGTGFGRTLSETISTALVEHGANVIDPRAAQSLSVQPKRGEFILSRDPEELSRNISADLAVTGTFSETPCTVIINARIIDLRTKSTVSVATSEIVKTPIIKRLLERGQAMGPTALDRLF